MSGNVDGDFNLFTDILDEIATKELEDERFFNDYRPPSTGGSIRSPVKQDEDLPRSEPPDSQENETSDAKLDLTTEKLKPILKETIEPILKVNEPVCETPMNPKVISYEEQLPDEFERNSLSPEIGFLVSVENTPIPPSRYSERWDDDVSSVSSSASSQHSEDEQLVEPEEKDDKKMENILQECTTFCEFLEEVQAGNKKLEITKKGKSSGREGKRKKKKKVMECACDKCKNDEERYINAKLKNMNIDRYVLPPQPPHSAFKRNKTVCPPLHLHQATRLDCRLIDDDNPNLQSWLSDKEKKRKAELREKLRHRRQQKVLQKQRKKVQQEYRQYSTQKVNEWLERKRQEQREQVRHLHPGFEQERQKIMRIERKTPIKAKEQVYERKRCLSARRRPPGEQETYKYCLNVNNQTVGFMTLESFTNSIISDVMEELERAARLKSARHRRHQQHAFTHVVPPRSAITRPAKSAVSKRPVWRLTTPGYSRTFEEWLQGKKDLDAIKARERITNQYYDELEKRILRQEAERRESARAPHGHARVRTALPRMLSSRLQINA